MTVSNREVSSSSFLGLIAVAVFPPLDCGSDSSFSRVVCGLDARMFQKREQAFPVLQQPFRCFGHVVISAVGVPL